MSLAVDMTIPPLACFSLDTAVPSKSRYKNYPGKITEIDFQQSPVSDERDFNSNDDSPIQKQQIAEILDFLKSYENFGNNR